MKDISVVVPVYNGASMLESCYRSICIAGDRVGEIIIVDDGSVDETLSVANTLAKYDCRIRVIHTDNHGSYMARAKGIRTAKLKYIAFIDVDDTYYEGALDLLVNLLEEYDADISIGKIIKTTFDNKNEEITRLDIEEQRSWVQTPEQMWIRIMKWKTQEFMLYLVHKLYKRDLFDGMPNVEGLCQGDDVVLTCHAFLSANKIVETNAPVYKYYIHAMSVTHKGFTDRDLDIIKAWDEVIKMVSSTENSKPYNLHPSLSYMARYNRWRTDFTLVVRLIIADDKDIDKKYADCLIEWRSALKKHRKELLNAHAMPKNRELLLLGICFFYKPTEMIMRAAKRILNKNTEMLIHNGDRKFHVGNG